jgi:hypothetical protein
MASREVWNTSRMTAPDESPEDQPERSASDVPGPEPILVRPYVSHLLPPTLLTKSDFVTEEMPVTLAAGQTPGDSPATGGHLPPGRSRRPLWVVIGVVLILVATGGTWLAFATGGDPRTGQGLGPALPAFALPSAESTIATASPTGQPPPSRRASALPVSSTAAVGRSSVAVASRPAGAATPGPTPLNIAPRTGALVGTSGKCVDGNMNGNGEGDPIQSSNCTNSRTQRWSFGTDATLRVQNMCMRPASEPPSPGTLLQARACDQGPYQNWLYRSDSSLINAASGLCLTDPGALTSGPSQLSLASCTGGANQRWTFT